MTRNCFDEKKRKFGSIQLLILTSVSMTVAQIGPVPWAVKGIHGENTIHVIGEGSM